MAAIERKADISKRCFKESRQKIPIVASDEIECDALSVYAGRTKADINRCNFSFDPDEQS